MEKSESEVYRLHGALPGYGRRVRDALDRTRSALDIPGVWAVSVSGGKDSTALASVCVEAGWRGPLFHFTYAETPQENTSLCEALAERWSLDLHKVHVPGAWDVFQEHGFFLRPPTREAKLAVGEMLRDYKRRVREEASRRGYAGVFLGLRASESKSRRIHLAKRGVIYATAGQNYACPLASWSARDVWARLVREGLPWLSWYDKCGNRELERSEITWLACPHIWELGLGQKTRRADPAEWQRLIARFPDLSIYG